MIFSNFNDFKRNLENTHLSPIYILSGSESYLIKEALSLIESQTLKSDDDRDFNFHQFFAPLTSSEEVCNIARTLPMLEGYRLIIYRNVHALSDKNLKPLLTYINHPLTSTVLVLVSEVSNKEKSQNLNFHHRINSFSLKLKISNKRTPLISPQRKDIILFEAKPIFDSQIHFWIKCIARKKNLNLDQDSLSFLNQTLGTNLSDIDYELEKLSTTFFGKKINIQNILEFTLNTRKRSVFELTRTLGEKKQCLSLMHLKQLLEQGEKEVLINTLIFRHMNILFQLKENLKKNLSRETLSSTLKIPSFFINQYIAQTHLWNENQMINAFKVLHETDEALKSSFLPSHFFMENLILKMLSA